MSEVHAADALYARCPSRGVMWGAAAATPGAWDARHAQICAPLRAPEVDAALAALAAHAAHAPAPDGACARLVQRQLPRDGEPQREDGFRLDTALALLWSAWRIPSGVADTNMLRQRALPQLEAVAHQALSERDFVSLSTLQRSATGVVEVVRCKFDRRLYVLKSVLKGVARREAYRNSPLLESAILAQEHYAGDRGAAVPVPELLAAFQSPGSVHIVLEYFPAGDLDNLLQAAAAASGAHPGRRAGGAGLLQEDWVVRYAVDIVAAVGWTHSLGFVHRDVKPANFLLHRSGHLKLCDFATCAPYALFPVPGGAQRCILAYYAQRPAGTCDYIAPEILRCEERRIATECPSPLASYRAAAAAGGTAASASASASLSVAPDTQAPGGYGPAADWWSVGVVLYEMTFGHLPFWAHQPAEVYCRIAHHEQCFSMDAAVPCSLELRGLIAALVCAEPSRLGRDATEQVQSHPLFRHVPWAHPWTLEPPFLPALATDAADESQPSVLHSPRPGAAAAAFAAAAAGDGLDSLSGMPSPPSFSAMYDGPLDQFPAFPDSVNNSPVASASGPPQLVRTPAPARLALSPVKEHDMSPPSWPSSAGEPPAAPADWADVDTHFLGFSFLPSADAFATTRTEPTAAAVSAAVPPQLQPQPHQAEPLASTPMRNSHIATQALPEISPLPALWGAAEPTPQESTPAPTATGSLPLQRRALEASRRSRASGAGSGAWKTPLRTPAVYSPSPAAAGAAPSGAGASTPASPYPFPVAAPRGAPVHRTPRMPSSRLGGSALGADSRFSGGSTRKRNLSEQQAWAQMMDAVERSARNLEPTAGEGSVPRSSSDSQLRPQPPRGAAAAAAAAGPAAPATSARPAAPAAQPAAAERSPPPPHVFGALAGAPLSSPASSTSSDASPPPPAPRAQLPRSSATSIDLHGHVHDAPAAPRARGILPRRRSTRQLLLDAQVTSTPTRSTWTFTGNPSPARVQDENARGAAAAGSEEDDLLGASPPRPRRRMSSRHLRISTSVRDFRELIKHDESMLPAHSALGTIQDASPERRPMRSLSPQIMRGGPDDPAPRHTAAANNSHRMLSEYRRSAARGTAAPASPVAGAVGAGQDTFGASARVAPHPSLGRARRMQSTLGLSGSYRMAGARPKLPSLAEWQQRPSDASPGSSASEDSLLGRMTRQHAGLTQAVTGLEDELSALRARVSGDASPPGGEVPRRR